MRLLLVTYAAVEDVNEMGEDDAVKTGAVAELLVTDALVSQTLAISVPSACTLNIMSLPLLETGMTVGEVGRGG